MDRVRPGSGRRTKTPTGYCASTFQKAPTYPAGAPKTSKPSPSVSEAGKRAHTIELVSGTARAVGVEVLAETAPGRCLNIYPHGVPVACREQPPDWAPTNMKSAAVLWGLVASFIPLRMRPTVLWEQVPPSGSRRPPTAEIPTRKF